MVVVPALYRRLFWPVLAPSLLFGVAAGATGPVLVLAALQLGASAPQAALVVAVLGGVSLVTTVPAGRLIDRLGDERAMTLATAAAALATTVAVTALAWGGRGALALFVASLVARAPATNVWGLARQTYVAERVPTREVGRAMTALGGTMRVGALVGPLAGGLLMLALPLWSVFVLSFVCSVLALVVLRSSSPGREPAPEQGYDVPVTSEAVLDDPAPPAAAPGAVRWDAVVLAGVAIATLAVARVSQAVVLQLWGVHIGLSASQISLAIALGAAAEIAMMMPAGYLKDRLGRSPVLIACLVIYGSGFLLLPLADTWWGMLGAVAVMAVGNGVGAGINMTIGADLSPAEGRGRFLGIWALFSTVGMLAGPSLVSLLLVVASTPVAVLSVGGLALTGAAWMALWARRIDLPRGL